MLTDSDLARLGTEAVERGLAAWAQGIMDPTRKAFTDPAFTDDRAFINDTIHSAIQGLGWSRCSTFVKDYRWDGDFEWCGAFSAAYCWARLKPDIRRWYAASTYRLFRYGRYKSPPGVSFGYPKGATPGSTPRKYLELNNSTAVNFDLLQMFGPRPGDILVVTPTKDGYGQHITLVMEWNPQTRTFKTVEANATGLGPKGERYQGVITRFREMSECVHIYRPGTDDLLGGP